MGAAIPHTLTLKVWCGVACPWLLPGLELPIGALVNHVTKPLAAALWFDINPLQVILTDSKDCSLQPTKAGS